MVNAKWIESGEWGKIEVASTQAAEIVHKVRG
jgi:hypothetical protein